jgi:hypothetical protein
MEVCPVVSILADVSVVRSLLLFLAPQFLVVLVFLVRRVDVRGLEAGGLDS